MKSITKIQINDLAQIEIVFIKFQRFTQRNQDQAQVSIFENRLTPTWSLRLVAKVSQEVKATSLQTVQNHWISIKTMNEWPIQTKKGKHAKPSKQTRRATEIVTILYKAKVSRKKGMQRLEKEEPIISWDSIKILAWKEGFSKLWAVHLIKVSSRQATVITQG